MEMLEIKKALDAVSDQVKEQGEKALAEAQRGIKMSEGVKETVDELLTEQGKFKAQLLELEQKAARKAGEGQEQGAKSIGYQVIESADAQARLQEAKRKGGRVNFDVKAITSASSSAGQAVYPDNRPGVLMIPNRRLTVRDLLAPGRTNSNLVNYIKETGFTNNAATLGEGVRKPESGLSYTVTPAQVRKIAHFIKATTEILDDFPALQSMIDQRLRYGLAYAEELQLLKGSGTGNNLNGIYTQATAFAAPAGTASIATGGTRIDVLRLALLQVELAEYMADGVMLNPIDWALIELTKDTQGRYIIGNPQGTIAPTIWGRPVVATQAMAQDTFLTGAWRMGAQIFDREDANVVIATENEDDFVNNLVTILAEERLALAVYRPEAFVKGDLTPSAT
jgi:HK97 family phage major capsid protein